MLLDVRAAAVALASLLATLPARAQRAPTLPSPDSLRSDLFVIADDSMGGRQTGSAGNAKTADWVAAAFARYGLEPGGERGTFFQLIPFLQVGVDTGSGLDVGGARLRLGRDLVPVGRFGAWTTDGATTIYGGVAGDSATWPAAAQCAGKVVVVAPPPNADLRAVFQAAVAMRRNPRFASAAGFAVASLDAVPPDLVDQILQGTITTDTLPAAVPPGILLVTASAAATMLGAPLTAVAPGRTGPAVASRIVVTRRPLAFPARNVIGILRGRDPALRDTYVSVSAHNDHVGLARPTLDPDSVRAFNRVVRPMGADSPQRPATAAEATRVAALRDSLRAAHAARRDSVYNGADDDGSGTVALVELARVLSSGPRPRRSVLFVSHAAEERGLLGSRWFTDHATVPVDSIVAELDMDMVGRGDAADLPAGGPGYLELVGSRRLSTELGALVDSLAARQAVAFHPNYEYDAPGHPLQYYCRADHYSYARYGIPSVSLSTGEHLDYHQVTDEAPYIDYDKLARVTALVGDVVLAVAGLDHRPRVDGRRTDPNAPCVQ